MTTEDHQRLRDAEDRDDRDLLQHQREIEWREELAGRGEGEDEDAREQDDERHHRRKAVQEALHPADDADIALVETGDRLVGPLQTALGESRAGLIVAHAAILPTLKEWGRRSPPRERTAAASRQRPDRLSPSRA